jgi:AraC-like DNA-binding protein
MARPARPPDLPIRSQLVGPVLAYVRSRGGSVDRLLRAFSLPDGAETDAEVTLPLSSLHAFFEASEREASDPFLGLNVAAHIPKGRWELLEYSARSAPTLREGHARVARYISLFSEHVVVTFEERAGEAVIAQRIPGRPQCLGRHGNEFFAAALVLHARAAAGSDLVPGRVFFAHPAPPDLSAFAPRFGTDRIEFGVERSGFSLPAAVLDRPLASADPALLSLLDRYAQRALAERGGAGGPAMFLGQVRQSIRATLHEGRPNIRDVARALRSSPRTLQRRLEGEGTSFQELLDKVREELARALIEERRRPLGEIAFLLGYTELGPFVRAFRRWTGKTPAAYREAIITADTRT